MLERLDLDIPAYAAFLTGPLTPDVAWLASRTDSELERAYDGAWDANFDIRYYYAAELYHRDAQHAFNDLISFG